MAFSKIYSAQNHLLKAHLVTVEVDLSKGLHAFSIVGLPDKAVEESRERVSAAIKNSGFKSPKQSNIKTTVSLAPANLKKEGPSFDVAIALGYLLATDNIRFDAEKRLFAGELSLDGKIRPIRGALSFATLAEECGMHEIYVPEENAAEATIARGVRVFGASSLLQIIGHLDPSAAAAHDQKPLVQSMPQKQKTEQADEINFDDIYGMAAAKKGLIIAAAGGHSLALFGPPGTGKTLLAKSFQSILPPLSEKESIEVSEIHSHAGYAEKGGIHAPPVRSPHHTSSYASIIGGGAGLRPGEVTLAHHGVLFLDEFLEFDRRVIEALRQPLEERRVSLSRAKGHATYPADFIFLAAMNPCPCGNAGSAQCRCSPREIARYKSRLSGPVSDRIDVWIELGRTDHSEFIGRGEGCIETENARRMVLNARKLQRQRFSALGIEDRLNSNIRHKDMHSALLLSDEAERTLAHISANKKLSGRGHHRMARLARTIADLEGSVDVKTPHVLEAFRYRGERFY